MHTLYARRERASAKPRLPFAVANDRGQKQDGDPGDNADGNLSSTIRVAQTQSNDRNQERQEPVAA